MFPAVSRSPGPGSPTVSVLYAPPPPRSREGGGWSLASRERSTGRCCNAAPLPRSIPELRCFLGTSRNPLSDHRPHLVETVLAVGFCLYLHLHQHRVRPRHIAQHGWGRRHRCHGRFFSGVRRGCRLTAIAPSRLRALRGRCSRAATRPAPHAAATRVPATPTTDSQFPRATRPRHSDSPTACAATGTRLL